MASRHGIFGLLVLFLIAVASACGDDDDSTDSTANQNRGLEAALLTPEDVGEDWMPVPGERSPGVAFYAGRIDILASAATRIFGPPLCGVRPDIPDLMHLVLLYPEGEQASDVLAEKLNIEVGEEPFTALGDRAVGSTANGDDGRSSGTIIIRRVDALSVLIFRHLDPGTPEEIASLADQRLRALASEAVEGSAVVEEPATISDAVRRSTIRGVTPEAVVEKLQLAGFNCDGPLPDIDLRSRPVQSWLCRREDGEDSIAVKVGANTRGDLLSTEVYASFAESEDPAAAVEEFLVRLVDNDYEDLTAEEAITFVRRNVDTGAVQDIGGATFEMFPIGSSVSFNLLANKSVRIAGGPDRRN